MISDHENLSCNAHSCGEHFPQVSLKFLTQILHQTKQVVNGQQTDGRTVHWVAGWRIRQHNTSCRLLLVAEA